MNERCENCGNPIGSLETPMVFQDHVVCVSCHRRLSASQPINPAPYARPAMPAEQKTSSMPVVFLAIAIALVVYAISSISDNKSTPGTVTPGSTASPISNEKPIRVSAGKLIAEYKTNEIYADRQYKGRLLQVDGVVKSIGKDILDKPYVILGRDDERIEFRSVQCFPQNADDVDALARMRPGQAITVTGRCDGMFGNILLK